MSEVALHTGGRPSKPYPLKRTTVLLGSHHLDYLLGKNSSLAETIRQCIDRCIEQDK